MDLEPIAVLLFMSMGSPIKFNDLAAFLVIKQQFAASSKRVLMTPSDVDIA